MDVTAVSFKAFGTLSIVGTPIGNHADISSRAVETLKNADLVACEERREASRLLKRHAIEKPLIEVNEHTEKSVTAELIEALLGGSNIALISDCGMPVFADPGSILIREALQLTIPVQAVPGPTSLTTALALSGMDTRRFYFYGFLSPKREERQRELQSLRTFQTPVVFLDAPYRLRQVLADMASVYGPNREVCIACDLTMPGELVMRGNFQEAIRMFQSDDRRREYVIIVSGANPSSEKSGKWVKHKGRF
jgi:16S rRNA (cytidine1402-2'-O)-methyltransferase